MLNNTFFWLNLAPRNGDQSESLSFDEGILAANATTEPPRMFEIRDGDQGYLFQTGLQLYRRGNYRGAIASWQLALKMYRENRRILDLARVAENLGNAYQNLQEYNLAIANWEIAADAYGRLRDWQSQGRIRLAQGQVYTQMGQTPEAIKLSQSALQIAQANRLQGVEVIARCQLGKIHWLRGNHDQAIAQLEVSLKLASKIGDIVSQHQIYLIFGSVYTTLALTNYRRADALHNLGDEREAVLVRKKAIKNDRNAIALFRQALTLAQQRRNVTDQVRALLSMIPPVTRNQQFDLAQTKLNQAESLVQQLPDSVDKAYLLGELAVLYLEPTDAFIFTAKCSDITEGSAIVHAMDLLHISANLAMQFQDDRAQSLAFGHIGHIQECQLDYENALKSTQTAQNLAKVSLVTNQQDFAVAKLDSLYLWEWQLGRIFAAQNYTEKAISAYESAISSLKSLEHNILLTNRDIYRNFRDGIKPVYTQLIKLHLQQVETQPEQTQLSLNQAVKRIDQLQRLAINNYLATNINQALLADPNSTIKAIPQTAIIYSLIFPEKTALITHFPNGEKQLQWIDIDEEILRQNVNIFRRELENRGEVNYNSQLAQQLYNLLIAPFAEALEQFDVKTLVFLQDGILRTIPMSALHDGKQFLINKYAVVNAPDISRSANQQHLISSREYRALAMGITKNIIVDGQTLHPLPNIANEIKSVIKQIPGSKKLMNEQFTRDRLYHELKHHFYPILHIATHAEFNAIADDTFLVTGDKTNNKLTISDLDTLLRDTTNKKGKSIDLIALTACGTAIDDERATLGFAGMAIQSGANSALASLWAIGDSATTQVVSKFYTHWRQDQLSKAIALQIAQKEMIANGGAYAHPFYWAPYILVGDWF